MSRRHQIIKASKLDIVEDGNVNESGAGGEDYSIAKLSIEFNSTDNVAVGYVPIVEGDEDIDILPLESTHIDARNACYKKRR